MVISEIIKKTPLLILAGGKATRLRHLADKTPKYLMPINNDKTFADFHLSWVKRMGFQNVILSIGHLGCKIKSYCGDGVKWDLQIKYSDEEDFSLGTGGAIQKAVEYLNDELLAVTYGDTYLNFNMDDFFNNFLRYHQSLKNELSGFMSVYKNNLIEHQSNIQYQPNSNYIIYDKIHPHENWEYIDYGFFLLKKTFLREMKQVVPFDISVSLSKESYKNKIMGHTVTERFYEIGSEKSLNQFREHFNL